MVLLQVRVHKVVTVGANLHSFIYNMLIDMSCNHLTLKISDEDMLNTRGLVPLTEHQKVG